MVVEVRYSRDQDADLPVQREKSMGELPYVARDRGHLSRDRPSTTRMGRSAPKRRQCLNLPSIPVAKEPRPICLYCHPLDRPSVLETLMDIKRWLIYVCGIIIVVCGAVSHGDTTCVVREHLRCISLGSTASLLLLLLLYFRSINFRVVPTLINSKKSMATPSPSDPPRGRRRSTQRDR